MDTWEEAIWLPLYLFYSVVRGVANHESLLWNVRETLQMYWGEAEWVQQQQDYVLPVSEWVEQEWNVQRSLITEEEMSCEWQVRCWNIQSSVPLLHLTSVRSQWILFFIKKSEISIRIPQTTQTLSFTSWEIKEAFPSASVWQLIGRSSHWEIPSQSVPVRCVSIPRMLCILATT